MYTLQMTTDLTHWQALTSRSVPEFRLNYEYYWPTNLRAFVYKRYRRTTGRIFITHENLLVPLTDNPPTTVEDLEVALHQGRVVHINQVDTEDEAENLANTAL